MIRLHLSIILREIYIKQDGLLIQLKKVNSWRRNSTSAIITSMINVKGLDLANNM